MSVTDSSRMERLSRLAPLLAGDFLPLLTLFFGIFCLSAASKPMQYAEFCGGKADLPVTEEGWTKKLNLFAGEHKLEGVREQLHTGWKDWLAAQKPGATAAGAVWGGPGSVHVEVTDRALIDMPYLVD